ncbi:MAG: hypothetical protein QM597_05225 [Aeromicrobium sp.]|uniref:hypothetical protein n=1 Tax=Aeromicrobium sp. TaxID=1871063 RepID=UPI0039E7073E
MPEESDPIRSRFDEIVDGLELEVPSDLTAAEPAPFSALRPEPEYVDFDDLPDEEFYREVPRELLPPMPWPAMLAWVTALGLPGLLVVCTMVGVFLPRPVVLSAGLLTVVAVVYLFSRLPSSRRDSGDDGGAVL